MRAELGFAAMGTHAHVLVFAGDETVAARLVAQATARIEQLEARWSRFRDASEVNRLNAAAGTPAIVSADTVRLVETMRVGYSVTHGAFDPTILHDLEALGYDRDFRDVRGVVSLSNTAVTRRPRGLGRFGEVTVSPKSGLVWLPAGVGIDPGGIGKGLAADIVAEELLAAGAHGALVNLGGDLRVIGAPDDCDCWHVDVDDPYTGEPVTRVALVDGGLATSSTERRTWERGGARVHHLIDPATGTSTDRGIVGATVIAREAWRAEVLTKACVVRGARGIELVDGFGAAARVTRADGRPISNVAWRRHERAPQWAGV
jgi:thiamine biosynthesis lipoprotein